ncbi:MAG TPA: CDP-alcohol phosphatidyltransferase family protein [Candidatus Humimicrobiaceae bacterium]|nr:CDP-alcohol phosphatidyltransferase family protein [Candidatus Humimicrobiaceae bacterium]
MLEEKREKFKKISSWTGNIFSKSGLTPNQYTLISFVFVLVAFYFLLKERLVWALIFFLLATFLDFIDGAVAKFLQKETKKGAYLDTICDRYVEGIILLGFLFLSLSDFFLPAKIWIFLAFFGSLMTTYAKAAAKEKELVGQELKKGLLGRAERIILISLAISLGIFNFSWIIYPIVFLAIFSNITVFQRIFLALTPSNN